MRLEFAHLKPSPKFDDLRAMLGATAASLIDAAAEQAHTMNVSLFSLLFGRYEGIAEAWHEVADARYAGIATPEELEASRRYMRTVMLDIATVAVMNVAREWSKRWRSSNLQRQCAGPERQRRVGNGTRLTTTG